MQGWWAGLQPAERRGGGGSEGGGKSVCVCGGGGVSACVHIVCRLMKPVSRSRSIKAGWADRSCRNARFVGRPATCSTNKLRSRGEGEMGAAHIAGLELFC
jgi:hypothetical protein